MDHSFVSPCGKIVYLEQLKVMSNSMKVFLTERNWKPIPKELIKASQTKLVLMRHPYDRIKSALAQAQVSSGLDKHTIDTISSKGMLLIDDHIAGFIGNLRRWEWNYDEFNIENLTQNLIILPINAHFPKMFELFFKKFNYDYNYNDVPRLNVSSNRRSIDYDDKMINGFFELELDTRLWNIIDTTYNWYRLDPEYKKYSQYPAVRINWTLNDIISNNDHLNYITQIFKVFKD